MNVWDTFCIGKTMTCDLCFVPAVIFKSSGQCNGQCNFHKRFCVSMNKFYRVIYRRNTCSILITLLESEYEKKQQ